MKHFIEYSLTDIEQNGISDLTRKHLDIRYGEEYTWRLEYATVSMPADFMEIKVLIFPTFTEGQPVDFGRTFRHTSGRYSVILRFYNVSKFCNFKEFEGLTSELKAQALTQILSNAECRVHSDDPSFFYQGCWEDLSKIKMNIYQFPVGYAGNGIWTQKHATRNGQRLNATDPRYYFHVTKHIAQIAKDRGSLLQPIIKALKGRIMEAIKDYRQNRLYEDTTDKPALSKEKAKALIDSLAGDPDTEAFFRFLHTSAMKTSPYKWAEKIKSLGFSENVAKVFENTLVTLTTKDFEAFSSKYYEHGDVVIDKNPGIHSIDISKLENLYSVTNRSNSLNRVGYGEVLLAVLANMEKSRTAQVHYDLRDTKGGTYEVKSGVAMLSNGGTKANVITSKKYTDLFYDVFTEPVKDLFTDFFKASYPSVYAAIGGTSPVVFLCDICMVSSDVGISFADSKWLDEAETSLSAGLTPQQLPGWNEVNYLFSNSFYQSSNHQGTRLSKRGSKRTVTSNWALDSRNASTTYNYLAQWLSLIGVPEYDKLFCYFVELIYRERFPIAMEDFLGKKGSTFSEGGGVSAIDFSGKIETLVDDILGNNKGANVDKYLAEMDFIVYATYNAMDNAPDSQGYMATQNKKQFDYILFMDLDGSEIKYVCVTAKTSRDVASNLKTELDANNLKTSHGYTNGNNSNVAIGVNTKK